MKKTFILLTVTCLTAPGADNVLSSDEKKAGFDLLFDGRTFNGWRDPVKQNPPGDSWVIEDGCLKTTPKPRIREDLVTQEAFGDFELKFDWKISARGNTGVKYRIQRSVFIEESKADRGSGFEVTVEREATRPLSNRATMAAGSTAQDYTISYEFQLIDDRGSSGVSKELNVHSTGALYSMISPRRLAAHAPGEWNESRLVVKGDRFEHWVNGTKVLDGSFSSEEARAGIAKRWAKALTIRSILENAKPVGPLSLQHHGAAVWFRNLKIRRL